MAGKGICGRAILLAVGIGWAVPGISWTSFVLIPQVFALLHRLAEAIVAVAILMIGYGAVMFSQSDVTGSQRWTLAFGLFASLGFATAVGVWISGIIVQSGQRAGLIQELESARAELAACVMRPASPPNANGCPGRSTTPSLRASPAS